MKKKRSRKDPAGPSPAASPKPKRAATGAAPEPGDLPPPPTAEELGTWAFLTQGMSEEEKRAMVEEFWLITHDVEKLRNLNRLESIVGPRDGRDPEKVHVQFRGEAVKKVMARKWHPTESWELHPHGTLDYWLEIAPCWQIKNWVLGFGLEARVISPPGFRAVMRDEGIKLMKKYGMK
jgi:hypothetical protein